MFFFFKSRKRTFYEKTTEINKKASASNPSLCDAIECGSIQVLKSDLFVFTRFCTVNADVGEFIVIITVDDIHGDLVILAAFKLNVFYQVDLFLFLRSYLFVR